MFEDEIVLLKIVVKKNELETFNEIFTNSTENINKTFSELQGLLTFLLNYFLINNLISLYGSVISTFEYLIISSITLLSLL